MQIESELTFFAALITGFVSSGHCAGMCGGIINFLAGSTSKTGTGLRHGKLPIYLAYNLGRITSYVIAGAIAGTAGSIVGRLIPGSTFHAFALLLSAVFMLGLAAYLAGWHSFLPRIEQLGGHLWRRIEPIGRRMFPVTSVARALCLGAIWGWLPCGLVYTALAWSVASGGPIQGGILMLGFGLGTVPMLLVVGSGTLDMRAVASRPLLRYSVTIFLLLLAMYMALSAAGIILEGPQNTVIHEH